MMTDIEESSKAGTSVTVGQSEKKQNPWNLPGLGILATHLEPTLLQADAFTQRSLYTEKLLHREAFPQSRVFTQGNVYTEAFTQRNS